MVTLSRTSSARVSAVAFDELLEEIEWFSVPSEEGNERLVVDRVAAIATALGLEGSRLEGLGTAVAEAVMNAIEHGNRFDPALAVEVAVLSGNRRLVVRIGDGGAHHDLPDGEVPDIEAKLAGLQSPRGWGLFLIEQMVDGFRHVSDGGSHVVELEMTLRGDG